MRRFLLLPALALLFGIHGYASAFATDTACDTPQSITEKLIASSAERGWTVGVYDQVTDATQVAQFVATFNATPPVSDIQSDMVMVYTAKRAATGQGDGNALVIYFNAGCQVPKAGMLLSQQNVDKILGSGA